MDENNTAHIAQHRVTPDVVEAVFWLGLPEMAPSEIRHRYLLEAVVEDRTYRLICDISHDETVYPITCFPI